MLLTTVVFFISTSFQYFGFALAAPASPSSNGRGLQLPSSRPTNASTPHLLSRPLDPSFYHLGADSPLYLLLNHFGEQMDYLDAADCLDDAWTDISNIIARSRRPQGGVVRTAHEWVHGAVRLKISPNFPSVMDYEVLQEYISGITGFATSHGGYWEWRITFEARVRQVEFRTYGRAQMSIARGT